MWVEVFPSCSFRDLSWSVCSPVRGSCVCLFTHSSPAGEPGGFSQGWERHWGNGSGNRQERCRLSTRGLVLLGRKKGTSATAQSSLGSACRGLRACVVECWRLHDVGAICPHGGPGLKTAKSRGRSTATGQLVSSLWDHLHGVMGLQPEPWTRRRIGQGHRGLGTAVKSWRGLSPCPAGRQECRDLTPEVLCHRGPSGCGQTGPSTTRLPVLTSRSLP